MTNNPMSSPTLWSRLFGALAASALAHPWRWLGGTALLCLAAVGLAATQLQLKTSNLDLVDRDLPEVARFLDFAERFGSPNMLVVVLEGHDRTALRTAVDRVAPRLERATGVRTVLARLPYDPRRVEELGIEPYFASRDHGMYFVLVQPQDATSSATELAPFVAGVRRVLDTARLDGLGVKAGLTGLPQYALDDRDIIQRDISRLSMISFAVVLAIIAAGFHALRRPLLAMGTLLLVAIVVIGVAAVVPGHLTLLSAFFFSALFGLGSDYGVYILHGMEERLAEGADLAAALLGAVRANAASIATAGLSTAAAFLALLPSGFRGFAELGFIGAVGIVLSLVAMVTVLPALLTVLRDRARRERRVHERRAGRVLLALQRPAIAWPLAAATLALVLAGPPAFDGDYTHLQPKHSEAVRLEREMVKRSGLSPQFAAFTVKDRDAASDLAMQLMDEKSVGWIRSRRDLERLDMAAVPEPAGRAAFERLFVAPDGTRAVYAYPNGDIWDPAYEHEFLARMTALDPQVTGMPVLGRFMIELSRRALVITAALSALLVLALVALEFGLSRYTLLAALPTFAGVAASVGAMRLLGLPFNPLNVMAFPVIIGTAVDAGVHLVARWLDERGDLARTIGGAGHTVFISGLTTVVGFGALAFTEHRGLASFAIVLALGSAICLVLSLLLLPRLLLVAAPRHAAQAQAAPVAAGAARRP